MHDIRTATRPMLTIQNATRRFGTVTALDAVSFDVAPGEIICLVGHSGCGKSTLLRIIAGVEPIDSGTISLGGSVVSGEGVFVEPENRQIGFMFQDYALFPHLPVRENIGFGLSRLPREERSARIAEILSRIGIVHLADRYPHMLSGGEQQRVALARALAPQPRILMMDEPFSNLDRGLRDTVRKETLAIVKEFGITAIVVTHDPEEALAIGDRVALMQKGRLVEIEDSRTIYDQPRSAYTAAFFSQVNRLPATQSGSLISTSLGQFDAPFGSGEISEILVRPHSVRITPTGTKARVASHAFLGEIAETYLEVENVDTPIVMRSTDRHALKAGDYVTISVRPSDVLILPKQ